MPSNRIGRINEEIQRELASQLRQLKDPRVSQVGMVSITRVDTTSDLRFSKIFVSVLDKSREKDVLKGLKSASGFLRRELGRALQLRYTPVLLLIQTFWMYAFRYKIKHRFPVETVLLTHNNLLA